MKYLSPSTMEVALEVACSELNLKPSATTHVDHKGCTAGEDRRKRLYVSVTTDGTKVLAFCHNCGLGGMIRIPTASKIKLEGPAILSEVVERSVRGCDIYRRSLRLWKDIEESYEHGLPVHKSLHKPTPFKECPMLEEPSVFYDESIAAYGCRYDAAEYTTFGANAQVMVPMFEDDELIGIAARRGHYTSLDGTVHSRSVPKWTRYAMPLGGLTPAHTDISLGIYNPFYSDIAVLCEDLISAMCLGLAGYAGVAIQGTYISSENVYKIACRYNDIVVWLDNDSETVIRNAQDIHSRFANVSNSTVVLKHPDLFAKKVDPKCFTADEMDEIIEEARHHNER